MAEDGKNLLFSDLCGLKLKQLNEHELSPKKKGRGRNKVNPDRKITPKQIPQNVADCGHTPFPKDFDYFSCDVYQRTFCSKGTKNGVLPTKDIHFSDKISNVSVTDLDYL